MSLTTSQTAHLVIALALLVLAALAGGRLFTAVRQPAVIGEILGGLLLGPTVLGYLAPGVQSWLFPVDGAAASALGAFYQLGMLCLMYIAGTELRRGAQPGERRTVAALVAAGLILPMAAGMGIALAVPAARYRGPDGSHTTFVLLFGTAIAVTSIPVISRIMLDLGILETRFARIVLAVAVFEDMALYAVLAVVLGLAGHGSSKGFGLWSLTHIHGSVLSATYYAVTSIVFFALAFGFGPRLVHALTRRHADPRGRDATAIHVALLLTASLLCLLLGINAVFGALAAGICVGRAEAGTRRESPAAAPVPSALQQVSMSFFVPVYFAIVGLTLNLRHAFDPVFFAWFFAFAVLIKGLSVWAGARLAGEAPKEAVDLAMAMNARGGPGIQLATVTYSAAIINERFFTALIVMSVLTSQIAGVWLDRRRSAPRNAAREQPLDAGEPAPAQLVG
jgi:Kef-type K+ transport system membrane component KefB